MYAGKPIEYHNGDKAVSATVWFYRDVLGPPHAHANAAGDHILGPQPR
jgi:hypothetical protein